jgi:hypothetical protein
MKKLLTLVALLTCFLGANAIEIVDAEVDFSKMADGSAIKFYGWGASASAQARLSIQNGCLHFHSDEATDPSWDCQFFPIGGVEAEVDVTYTLHFKIKGTVAQNVSMLGFGQTPYGQFPITTDWVEGTVDYLATSTDGNILMQCGDYVGEWDIAYLKITHEGKEQRPVQWANIIQNGDAGAAWANPDMAASDKENGTICAWSKEWGTLMNGTNANAGGAAIPEPHPAYIEDGVFVCHSKAVNPPLTWAEAGEQWGQQHAAGDEMVDNTWQNQFWINFPRAMKDGEQVKLSFRYRASKDVSVPTQDHQESPGTYLGGGKVGTLSFTTEWQTYEKEFSAAGGVQSIAFNVTGDGENWKEDIDFYFDDITVSLMVLDNGFFVASTNTETGLVDYDLDNAIEFEGSDGVYSATVGKVGNKDSWVNELMISTVRGNDKAFKAATLKVSEAVRNDADTWINYSEGSNAKIKLPAAGVWTITINTEYQMINFVKLEGEADKEPIEITPNPTEVVVKGQERDDLADGEEVREEEGGTGQTWDNQFFIVANRTLNTGEVTVLQFKYKASREAKTTTQCHGDPGAYMHYGAIGDVNFTTEWQDFSTTYTVPSEANGMKSFAFNMAEIKEACDYEIKDIVWKLEDNTESLIDMTGAKNFYVKEGAGTTPYIFGTSGVTPGDANGDGVVNAADIVEIVNFIMESPSEKFNQANADANGDGTVNAADIVAVVNMIMKAEARPSKIAKDEAVAYGVGDVSINPGEKAAIEISLDGAEAYTSATIDLQLPAGISIAKVMNEDDEEVFDVSSERTKSKHALEVALVDAGNNIYRIMTYASNNATFKASGVMFAIGLQAAADAADGVYAAKIIADGEANGSKTQVLVTPDGTQAFAKDVEFNITVGSGTGINNLSADNDDAPVYNLSGQLVKKASKGLFIKNGKKMIQK